MTDESQLRADMGRGAQAKAILDNEAFADGFARLRLAYLDAWENTKPLAITEREKLWLAVHVLDGVRRNLEEAVSGGVIARAQLAAVGLI